MTGNQFSACEIARRLENGETTSETLTDDYLARIEANNDYLHAFIDVYSADARRAARAADLARKSGHAVGPFHGIPVAIKDIIDIRGRITTGGSKVWAQRRSPVTATLVSRLIGAGMIVIGKTHSVEFAMGSWGTNQHLGSPRNPWDTTHHRAAGGSSSGSAAAVAAGLCPWAIGTDTGGSVRIPSAFCGLSGLKTTIGRISCYGVLPLSTTLDSPGPLCLSVEDAAHLYALMRGSDREDPRTLNQPPDTPLKNLKDGVDGFHLASIPDNERDWCDADVLKAYDESLAVLASLGARISQISLPTPFADLGNRVGEIIGAEGYRFVGDLVADPALPVDDDVRPRIQLGAQITAPQYVKLLDERAELKRAMAEALRGCHALLTPATTHTAPIIEEIDQTTTAAHFTRPVNYLDYCALALPNGRCRNHLPTALQVVCGEHEESTALRIGHAYQQATDWHQQRPAA